jgi:flagellar protein FlaG
MNIDNSPAGVSGAAMGSLVRPVAAQSAAPVPMGAPAMPFAPSNAASSSANVAADVLRKPDVDYNAEEVRRNLSEAIDRLNDQMRQNGRDLAFRLDEKVDRTVITVRQAETGEVVRQIPSEDVLNLAHSIEDIKGLLFNETT